MAAAPSFLSRLEESVTTKNTKSFLMADVRMLLYTSKFSGWVQQRAYLWVNAMTSSRGCVGERSQDWTEPISTPEWCALLGCKERHATDMLTDAAERGLLKRKEVKGKGFRYQVCQDITGIADYTKPEPQPVEEAVEDEVEDSDVLAAGEIELPPVIIRPKSKSKPVDLTTAVSSVRYISDSESPINVVMRAAKGVLSVRFALPKSEEKGMNPCTPVHPPIRPELREIIQNAFITKKLGEVSDSLWNQVCNALGSTPDEWMAELVAEKLQTRNHIRWAPGLFIRFAEEAAQRCFAFASRGRKFSAAAAAVNAEAQAIADEFDRSPFGQWLRTKGLSYSPANADRLEQQFEAEQAVAS